MRIDKLRDVLRRNRNLQFLYAAALIAIGLGFVLIPQSYNSSVLILFDVLGFGMAIGGGYIAVINFQLLNIDKSKVIKLTKRPDQVVWIYHEVVVSMPFGFKTMSRATIYLNLEDGGYEFFQVKPKKAEEMMNYLRNIFTTASYGHSVEKEQLYRANPELLRKVD